MKLADLFHWPEVSWLHILSDHLTLTLRVECFRQTSSPAAPFHLREAKETLRFYDDFLPDHPVYLLRLERDARLRLGVKPTEELAIPIEGIVTVRIESPDGDLVEVETVQTRRDKIVEAVFLLQPSKFKSKKLHVISPYFGLVDRKYVRLTVRVRILLGAPFRREVDLCQPLYCKIVHPRSRLRFHRWIGMFENGKEHEDNN